MINQSENLNYLTRLKVYPPLITLILLILFTQVTFAATNNHSGIGDVESPVALNEIRVITADFPPYSYFENGQAKGVAVEKAKKLFKQLGINPPIEVVPWSRAYTIAKTSPNTLIFSMARSEEREKLFHWIGTITNFNVKVFKLKTRRDIVATTPRQLSGYRVGTLLKDIKGDYLRGLGIDLNTYHSEESGIHMLFHNRIDVMPADEASFRTRIEKLGYSMDDVEAVLTLDKISKPLYLALNIETPSSVVEAFKDALKAINSSAIQ